MIEKKIKSCPLSVKDIDGKQGIVQFYASAFGGEKDSDGDIILKGSFTKTLNDQKGRIKHLLNHDVNSVPGVIIELKEDSKGLLVTSQLAKGSDGEFSTLAKDTLINYEAGVITEHSIGYKATQEDYDKEKETNFIKEIKLWETSSLTGWGANKNTPFVGMKSQKDLEDEIRAIEKVLHSSSISDEGASKLLKHIERINTYLKSLKEPVDATQKSVDYTFLKQNFKL